MKAAEALGVDYRWIWLLAEQGLVGHLEVESAEGRRKTYYVMADLERELARLRVDFGRNTREYLSGYLANLARGLGFGGFVPAFAGADSSVAS
jgi:hypothetical protein